ncbi:unnamed protein product [marine sediment metagenome]|uniref:Uncharacterized protein n=1 Tax=marine sediment metagenome TaxID=412755 RepID=X1K659_9ZZZZ
MALTMFPLFSIITISDADITGIVGWAGTLVGDLMPLLIVIFGISIGAYVIQVIISRLRG